MADCDNKMCTFFCNVCLTELRCDRRDLSTMHSIVLFHLDHCGLYTYTKSNNSKNVFVCVSVCTYASVYAFSYICKYICMHL